MKIPARMEDKVRIKNLKSLLEFLEKFGWVLPLISQLVVFCIPVMSTVRQLGKKKEEATGITKQAIGGQRGPNLYYKK